jgi:hypothetical protein
VRAQSGERRKAGGGAFGAGATFVCVVCHQKIHTRI